MAAREPSVAGRLENWSKVISMVIAVAGVLIGIYEFQSQQRYNETHEFKLRIWEQRLSEYTKLSEISGKIIVCIDWRKNKAAQDSLSQKFHELYYSTLPMVQDTSVEKRLIDFNLALLDYNNEIETDEIILKKKQLHLMEALGVSIRNINHLIEDE